MTPGSDAGSHDPVMVAEVLKALALRRGCKAGDGTVGLGGHAAAMAPLIGSEGLLLGLDRDPEMLRRARARLDGERGTDWPEIKLFARPYEEIAKAMAEAGASGGLDAIVLDLGVNSAQIDSPERGFSFMKDGPLDMRFNPEEGGKTVADLVNTASEKELARWLRAFGDERLARPIARRIAQRRAQAPLRTTRELAELVAVAYPPAQRHGRIHPATRTFQALRIVANDELGSVERGLQACLSALAPGGRLAVLTFHSGEDKLTKIAFREAAIPPEEPSNPYSARANKVMDFFLPIRKAIECSAGEAERNPRARSAKLRVIERRGGEAAP